MGVIRKVTSVSTMGLVDFRSDKERIARNTKKTNKSIREQTQAMQAIAAQQAAQQHAAMVASAQMTAAGISGAIAAQTNQQIAAGYATHPAPSMPLPYAAAPPAMLQAPGQPAIAPATTGPSAPQWYPDPLGIKRLRWHDGVNWTDYTAD